MLLVLPFESLCGDDEQEFFARIDGRDDFATRAARPQAAGRDRGTSAVQYKATKKSIGEIAAELHIDCVLEGSVRCDGGRVRITGQLIEARDQTHLWSASYDETARRS